MATKTAAHPKIVSPEQWLAERKELLAEEKELTRLKDRGNAKRRRLPMEKIKQDYVFDTPSGKKRLVDLFDGRLQLIVYHFMFDPAWEKGCPGCTGLVNTWGDLSMLGDRNTTITLISRAPLEKLEAYKKKQGWEWPWASSFGSSFNFDFHVTIDESVRPFQYNYLSRAEFEQRLGRPCKTNGEQPGLSVFFRLGDEVYHTYSTFGRGVEGLTDSYSLLDVTPYGRQESFEDSPEGWPQKPTYG